MEVKEDHFVRVITALDSEHAVDVGRHLVNQFKPDDPGRIARANTIATYFGEAYRRTGKICFLDEATALSREALAASSISHPSRATLLSNLAGHLGRRYEKYKRMADLEEGLKLLLTAAQHDENAPHRDAVLNNLANKYVKLYDRTKATKHLHEAISIARELCNLASNDESREALYLNSLANWLRILFSESADEEDLVASIRTHEKALSKTSETNPYFPDLLHNLALSFSDLYSLTNNIECIDRAAQHSKEALKHCSSGNPHQADYRIALGNSFRLQYFFKGKQSDLDAAMAQFKSALGLVNTPIKSRILAGRYLALCELGASNWSAAYTVSAATLDLVPLLTAESFEISDKQHILSEITGLASDAAATALISKQNPFYAVRMLEMGRSVLLKSQQDLRSDLSKLEKKHSDLAEEYENLRDELRVPVKDNAGNSTTDEHDQEIRFQRQDTYQKFQRLLPIIRAQPGFEDFLQPLSEEQARQAAVNGPIVVLNASVYRYDAIIIETHRIRAVDLPGLDQSKTQEMIQKLATHLGEVLEWLWNIVAKPVLSALDLAQNVSDLSKAPHIWWIPTGAISRFPIHAAGCHAASSGQTVMDRAISSYSVSLTALLNSRSAKPPAHAPQSALLVSMRSTPMQSELPNAKAEIEQIEKFCNSASITCLQPTPEKQAILANLPACQIFHFAGHGLASKKDPLQSSLLLQDWQSDRLTVLDIIQTDLYASRPFLAFLSACGTGEVRDHSLLDENIHLISAFQSAGFRHAIGTLWRVDDEAGMEIADTVYKEMIDEKWSESSVCIGLHRAIKGMRDRWVNDRKESKTALRKISRRMDLSDDDDDDDDDDEETGALDYKALFWVPYVHFGV
ncbi:MAG: hypothetical protein LQ340_005151 [Diploschistes diacapsis]|nr:MAG: hypothetical protein LQ340_005151 [Diploschistes diacapsis]